MTTVVCESLVFKLLLYIITEIHIYTCILIHAMNFIVTVTISKPAGVSQCVDRSSKPFSAYINHGEARVCTEGHCVGIKLCCYHGPETNFCWPSTIKFRKLENIIFYVSFA